jgi:O-antigen/teichoic acid export membrane protein
MTLLHLPKKFSLKRRILNAGSWSLAGYALNYPIRLGTSLVMTRLLVPQMFGVMSIAIMAMTGLAMFSDIGLSQNIVQSKRGGDPAYLNTVWSIQILRGVLLWVLGLCIALLVFAANRLGLVPKESVYADPYLPYVLAAISFTMVIGGLRSTKASEASRRLALGRITQMQIVSQIAGLICMIGWVLIERSIWGLVAGYVCSMTVSTLLSHIWLPGTANRWHWDGAAFHEILHFGKWMFLSSLLGFFANNTDRMLLGGYVDATTLGIYSIALTIVGSISQILSKLISDVSYSALSEVARERTDRLKHSLYRFHVLTASFAYFCAGGLIVSGGTLIKLLYDPRYSEAGWMLEILAVGLMAAPFDLAMYALLARGLPKIFSHIIAVHVAITVVFIPLGYHYFGLPGALCAIVASQLSNLPMAIYFQIKQDLFDAWKELLLLPTLLVGMLAGEGFNLVVAHWSH